MRISCLGSGAIKLEAKSVENSVVNIIENIPVSGAYKGKTGGILGIILEGNNCRTLIEIVLENIPEPLRNFDCDCGITQDFFRSLFIGIL